VLDDRGHNFLDLVDEDSNPLELSIANSSLWLKHLINSTCFALELQEQSSIMH